MTEFIDPSEVLSLSEAESAALYGQIEDIIESMDDKGINEMLQMSGNDFDSLLKVLMEETNNVINLHQYKDSVPVLADGSLPAIKAGYEDYLRKKSLLYFVSSVLPEYELAWHCIEWLSMIQLYRFLCVICSRDHSKSFTFSFAHVLWRLYRYEKPSETYIPPADIKYYREGMLITNEFKLAKKLLKKVKEEIKLNPILNKRLYPEGRNTTWANESIQCTNGAEVTLSSFRTSNRGPHPGWIVVDDFLDKSAMYSKDQREKFKEVFNAEIHNMILPQGQICVVGCVSDDTLILTDRGFIEIGSLCDIPDKDIKNISLNVADKGRFSSAVKFFNNGNVKTLKITAEESSEIECSMIHPLLTLTEKGSLWKQSSELKVGDWVGISVEERSWEGEISLDFVKKNQELLVHSRNNIKEISFPDYFNEDFAYLVGVWIAEGSFCRNSITITTTDRFVIDFLESLETKYGMRFGKDKTCPNWICHSRSLSHLFEFLGYRQGCHAGDKEISPVLLKLSKALLRNVIKGIFDGDGCCENRYPYKIHLVSVSRKLIYQVKYILQMGWGICSNVSVLTIEDSLRLKSKIKHNYDSYTLTLYSYDAFLFRQKIGFCLKRKQERPSVKCEQISNIPTMNDVYREILLEIKKNPLYKGLSWRAKYGLGNKKKYSCIKRSFLKSVVEEWSSIEDLSKWGYILEPLLDPDIRWVRIKSIEKFENHTVDFVIPGTHSFITNGIISHNTPFHEKDLYHDLKEDPSWAVFEYPALFPDGSVLWDNRYDFESLKKKRTTLGPLIFSREILVRPVSDSTTIFPWSVLERAFVGTTTICMAPNRASFPVKMKKVAIGVDWALSANVGADDSWFVVLGEDYADQMWLMWFEVLHGARYNAQISKLRALNIAFDADVIVAETNVFQKVMADLAKDAGITNIVEEVTGNNKKDIYEGLPALVILFDQYKYKFPRGDARSVEKTNLLCSQLNSIAFDDDKGTLESVSEHDDGCMALYFATKGIKSINGVFRVSTT